MSSSNNQDGSALHQKSAPPLSEVISVSLKVGLLSFGGPAAQISVMHQEFVENRKWLSEDRFLHALNYCMLLPGPEAQQLATYCGWLCARTVGGLIAGLLFILPGAITMALVSFVYAAYGDTAFIVSVFYGVKAGVLAIVLQALLKIGRKALKSNLAWAICGLSFVALFFFSIPFPIVIIAAALSGLIFGAPSGSIPADKSVQSTHASVLSTIRTVLAGLVIWMAPPITAALVLAPDNVLLEVAEFFSVLAVVSFGGAYALLSYMAQVAVDTKAWLSAGEMLDGLGLAETTPGPLILVTQFVGFLGGWRDPGPFSPVTSGMLAAAMTTWVTFAPSFLFVLAGPPWMERLRGNRILANALSAITAAVAGTILNLAVWFAINVLFTETSTARFGALEVIWPDLATIDPALAGIAALAITMVFVGGRGMASVLITTACLGYLARTFLG
ncbi:chromate efflux transporter [uncultured Roseibium sp.]|uniref:chromate efflux transporter n=1 Tax=uncultured Roseibium sp. TaxID=1936171 RepID=UPI0026045F05|nr:chromate efflux transporter [uncultured Roseibium sp.]